MNDATVSTISHKDRIPVIEAAFQAQDYQLSGLEGDNLGAMERVVESLALAIRPVRTNPKWVPGLQEVPENVTAGDLETENRSALAIGIYDSNERIAHINQRVARLISTIERLIEDIEL